MITTRTLACLSIVSLLPFTSLVHAEMGPYVGIGAGFTQFDDDGFIDDLGAEDGWDDSGTAYRFIAGYKFSDNFSAEWSYQDYNYNEYGVDALSNVEMQAWHLSVLAAYPIEESPLGKLDIFGKLGFGEADYRYKGVYTNDTGSSQQTFSVGEEQTSESFILGAGAQFYLNPDFRLRTELDMTTFNLDTSFGNGSVTYVTRDYSFRAMTASASIVYAF
ncbi:outer membrane beta-barrel protein [Litoribrevibacter albus]|uniref:Outer membrane protein OmpA-like transmembrane domain-containing protein n=1 Tax=Litoribrevibacter albus TaxID=1473156 RepID=A0AA37W9W4_9GAMM|nr:outer membrane beta-barrel protein [Litoribrevibacter albus]GLQ33041.1 hypothetical protein GCM10007876_35200 [Litoribrevibacter albus]